MAIDYRLHPKFLRIEVSTGIACRVWKVVSSLLDLIFAYFIHVKRKQVYWNQD